MRFQSGNPWAGRVSDFWNPVGGKATLMPAELAWFLSPAAVMHTHRGGRKIIKWDERIRGKENSGMMH